MSSKAIAKIIGALLIITGGGVIIHHFWPALVALLALLGFAALVNRFCRLW